MDPGSLDPPADDDEARRSAFERSRNAMVILDEEGRCHDLNPAACELLGADRAAVKELRPGAVPPAGSPEDGASTWLRLVHSRPTGELAVVQAGTPRVFEIETVADVVPGRHLRILRDVSEQRRQWARRELAERAAMLTMVVSGVAHELNNPLAGVMANLDVAVRDAETLATNGADHATWDELVGALGDATAAASRLRRTVRELVILTGAGDGGRRPTEVRRTIETTLRLVASQLGHRARLVTEYAETPTVDADEGVLARLLLQMLRGAGARIPAGGEDRELRVVTRTRGRDVEIAVREGLVGGCAEVQPGAPGPAPLVEAPAYAVVELSVCREIAAAMGGAFEIVDSPGCGTSYVLTLPASPPRG